jgi:hypothetical protein
MQIPELGEWAQTLKQPVYIRRLYEAVEQVPNMQIKETRIVILISIKAVTKEIRVEKWLLVPPNIPRPVTRQAIDQLRQQPKITTSIATNTASLSSTARSMPCYGYCRPCCEVVGSSMHSHSPLKPPSRRSAPLCQKIIWRYFSRSYQLDRVNRTFEPVSNSLIKCILCPC